jgi:hypothetical protein
MAQSTEPEGGAGFKAGGILIALALSLALILLFGLMSHVHF